MHLGILLELSTTQIGGGVIAQSTAAQSDRGLAAIGTDARLASFAVPSGRRQRRDGLALGQKFNF